MTGYRATENAARLAAEIDSSIATSNALGALMRNDDGGPGTAAMIATASAHQLAAMDLAATLARALPFWALGAALETLHAKPSLASKLALPSDAAVTNLWPTPE